MGAEVDERADGALGGRITDPASMGDQIPGHLHPIFFREHRPEVLLDAVVAGTRAGEAEPGGDPGDVAVDGDRWHAEGVRDVLLGGLQVCQGGQIAHLADTLEPSLCPTAEKSLTSALLFF